MQKAPRSLEQTDPAEVEMVTADEAADFISMIGMCVMAEEMKYVGENQEERTARVYELTSTMVNNYCARDPALALIEAYTNMCNAVAKALTSGRGAPPEEAITALGCAIRAYSGCSEGAGLDVARKMADSVVRVCARKSGIN